MLTLTPPDAKLVEAVRDRLEAVWMPGDWFELTEQVVMHYAWKAAVMSEASRLWGMTASAKRRGNPLIVEIGARCGYSLAAFTVAFELVGMSENWTAHHRPTFLCIDGETDLDSPQCSRHFETVAAAGPFLVLRIAARSKALDRLPFSMFAHVDGDHSHAGCRHDLNLVAGCRVILADDCDNGAVRAAVVDFVAANPCRSVQFVNDGLRTLGVISSSGPTGPTGPTG